MAQVSDKRESVRDAAKYTAKRFLRRQEGLLLIVLLIVVGVLSPLTRGRITTPTNIANVLLQNTVLGVATVGQAFVILAGGIDISIAAIGLVTSNLGGVLMTSDLFLNPIGQPVSMFIAIPIMLAVGGLMGLANGVMVSRVGMPPLIVTLGMWQIGNGLAFVIGQGRSVAGFPESLRFLGVGYIGPVQVAIIIAIAVFAVAYLVLEYTTFGYSVYTIGGNPVSAHLCGINVKNITLAVYVISGCLGALAGALLLARVMSVSLVTLQGFELETITACAIAGISLHTGGGRGSILGVVLGVLFVGVVKNALSLLNAEPSIYGITTGGILIAALAIDYVRRRHQ